MSTISVLDLRHEVPRSPFAELAGLPWLARLVDKVRAAHKGQLGEYVAYPCGGDRHFLGTFGLDADALKAVIEDGATDEAIGTWAKAHATGDFDAVRAGFLAGILAPTTNPDYLPYLEESKKALAEAHPELDVSVADSLVKLICVEEGHPIPA